MPRVRVKQKREKHLFSVCSKRVCLSRNITNLTVLAARKMDWEFFLTSLTAREQLLVEYLLVGRNMSELAKHLGLDRSTIQYCVFRRKSDMIPILFGQRSNPFRTPFRFNSDSVPGVIRTVFRHRRNGVQNGSE